MRPATWSAAGSRLRATEAPACSVPLTPPRPIERPLHCSLSAQSSWSPHRLVASILFTFRAREQVCVAEHNPSSTFKGCIMSASPLGFRCSETPVMLKHLALCFSQQKCSTFLLHSIASVQSAGRRCHSVMMLRYTRPL